MKQHTPIVTFALIPRVGCAISVNGVVVETCSLAEKNARLAAYGRTEPKTPRRGFAASGRIITKRGK